MKKRMYLVNFQKLSMHENGEHGLILSIIFTMFKALISKIGQALSILRCFIHS